MSQYEKGSSYQLLRVIEQDPKTLFNLVENGLASYSVRFDSSEQYSPNQQDKAESTIETFIREIAKEFSQADLKSIYNWWAPVKQTPNWDFISTCNINGSKGILLVEAKSHTEEMEEEGKPITVDLYNKDISEEARLLAKKTLNLDSNSAIVTEQELKRLIDVLADKSLSSDALMVSCKQKLSNHEKIGKAISEAKEVLLDHCNNIAISRDSHYQLSNRIAYTWKLASIGIPTILLYLGFTEDPAWKDQFKSDQMWNKTIQSYFSNVKAKGLLDKKHIVLANGVPAYFIADSIRAEQ